MIAAQHNTRIRSGFTLVELSIVLVILGLLVGGVLAGQSLIRSAQLRAIATEKDRYITALNAFRDKYFALPGDMPNAYAYWGTACGTNTTDLSTGCNGDGNGLIQNGENVKAWEHLARAGLIEGAFDGTGTAYNAHNVILSNQNVPGSKFPQGYWNISDGVCEGCGDGAPVFWPGRVILAIGALTAGDGSPWGDGWIGPLVDLSNGEALNIDRKVDDGHSYTGAVRGINAQGICDDANGSGNGTDYYSLIGQGADTKNQCVPQFLVQ